MSYMRSYLKNEMDRMNLFKEFGYSVYIENDIIHCEKKLSDKVLNDIKRAYPRVLNGNRIRLDDFVDEQHEKIELKEADEYIKVVASCSRCKNKLHE